MGGQYYNTSSCSFFTLVCQAFFCSLSFFYIYSILYISMVGVNHLFIVMKAKKKKKTLVLSFLYIYLKYRWKKKPFNHFTFVEHILWTIIIVLSYKYSSNETIKSKKQRHELFFFLLNNKCIRSIEETIFMSWNMEEIRRFLLLLFLV
jgi:hypothetical protein